MKKYLWLLLPYIAFNICWYIGWHYLPDSPDGVWYAVPLLIVLVAIFVISLIIAAVKTEKGDKE